MVSQLISGSHFLPTTGTKVDILLLAGGGISAAAPASQAALSSGHVTVTSHHKDLPLCQGTRVTPCGLLPSDWSNLTGSLETGTPAEAKLITLKLDLLIGFCLPC